MCENIFAEKNDSAKALSIFWTKKTMFWGRLCFKISMLKYQCSVDKQHHQFQTNVP